MQKQKNLIFTFDPDYKIISANDEAAEFLGKTPNRIIDKLLFETVSSELPSGRKKNISNLFKTGNSLVINDWMEFDNIQRYFHAEFEPVLNEKGKVKSILAVALDQTVQKRQEIYLEMMSDLSKLETIEELMLSSLSYLNKLIPCDGASIAIADKTNELFRIYSLKPDGRFADTGTELPFSDTIMTDVLNSGRVKSRNSSRFNPRRYLQDSDLKKGKITGQLIVPINDSDGVIGTINILSKSASRFPSDIEKSVMDYANLIVHPIQRLNRFNTVEEQKNELDFFSDLLIHDQNNINQGLIGYNELLKLQPGLNEKHQTLINESMTLVQNSINLLSNAKVYSRLRKGRLENKPVDVITSYNKAVLELQTQFPHFNIKFSHNLKQGKHYALAGEFLKDILVNLFSHIINQSEGLTGYISVKADRKYEKGKPFIRFEISDHHKGLSRIQKEMVFESFKKAIQLSSGGPTLGLSIVYEVISAYDGQVWVEDRIKGDPEKGTKYVFLIPALKK